MAGLTPLLGKSGPLVSAVHEVIQEVPRLRSTAGWGRQQGRAWEEANCMKQELPGCSVKEIPEHGRDLQHYQAGLTDGNAGGLWR